LRLHCWELKLYRDPLNFYLSSPSVRHCPNYPSQPTWAEISICIFSPLPLSFLSGHSDSLRECRSITRSNPLTFINSAHYELFSHRESKSCIGNLVFLLRNVKLLNHGLEISQPPSRLFTVSLSLYQILLTEAYFYCRTTNICLVLYF
jgi:hypothetical protein